MPTIDRFPIPAFLDQLPYELPRPYSIMSRPGMSASSVLFLAKRYPPRTIRTVSTAASRNAAMALAKQYYGLTTKAVTVDDGVLSFRNTVILSVSSLLENVGLTIGGNASGDAWQITTTWEILCDADQVLA